MKQFVLIVLFAFCVMPAAADYYTTPFRYEEYETCRDVALGLRFACRSQWQVEFEGLSDHFMISQDPMVEMILMKESTELVSVEQISVEMLENMNRYAPGFQTERVVTEAIRAVKVKAFSAEDTQTRLTDVYFLHQGELYKIYFQVSPREAWDVYQFLWEKIIFSMDFL